SVHRLGRLLPPSLLIVLVWLAPACASDSPASLEGCNEICAERHRGCFQEACAEIDDEDSLCARRCRERQENCQAGCRKEFGAS
ncbi:MAG: hypothetical protein Q8R92_10270, partial [Deltaproteobacteria bacterium]|nr:hypothetical protein [Deltaproteobacteria bacterium]